MPPNNRKKKKPASNPARGFATVSVPSKPKATESPGPASTADSKPVSVAESDRPTPIEGKPSTVEPTTEASSLQNYTPEELERHLEEAELQLLVEKYASKCRSDAARQVTKLETERRVLRQQAASINLVEWFSTEVLTSILSLAETEERELSPLPGRDAGGQKKPVSEEDLYMRLWTLQETLLKLGFPEAKVNESLKHLLLYFSGNFATTNREVVCNLDEALDWLAMHCDPKELPSYMQTNAQQRNESDKHISWINDREPSQSSTPSRGPVNSKVKKPKSPVKEPSPALQSSPYDSDSSLDPDTLVPKYLDLQSRLYGLRPELFDQPRKGKKGGRKPTGTDVPDPQITRLQRKIASIENDVLFDRHEAEYKWSEKLDDLRKEAAFARRSQPEENPIPDDAENEQLDEKKAEPDGSVPLLDNEESTDLLGDMFQDEEPVLEIGVITEELSKASIKIRDFGKWTGLSPRRVLEETCKSRDTGCKITYKDSSASSHSNRAAVEVRWSKPQEIPFPFVWDTTTHNSNAYTTFVSMDSMATPTSQQAESFVSTLVLFILFSQNSKEGKAYLRLPAVWRELWTEFANAKKVQEDEVDKQVVKSLKKLVQDNHGAFEDDVVLSHNFRRRNGASSKPESPARGASAKDHSGLDTELTRIWAEKSSTASFQYMVQGRMNLPIWNFRDEILSTLDTHRALIICSETGSGKSTQIPSFILEHEMQQGRPCKIYVTEPRRISAISLARRVSEELGENKNDVGTARSLIGFAVRLESKVSQFTRLVFATTGVVVRMLERPDDFRDITHVVLDEVHERSIDSDFLLIVLRRLMQRRPDLKLILMSATLEAQRFSTYLGGVPVLNIPGRTFPVEMKFLEDAIEMTNYRLLENDPNAIEEDSDELALEAAQGDTAGGLLATLDGYSKQTRETVVNFDEYRLDYQLIKRLVVQIASSPDMTHYSKAILIFMPGMAEIRRLNDEILSDPTFQKGWIVHALHSSIASEDQEKAFVVPPEGMRKIVIATNIAETGITIPDITAVIDAGKEKSMRFDERRQLSRLVETFISRANAKQRRGRAGRVQDGICFHLFTKHRHEKLLAEQQTPEMLRLSLQDLVLRVKICKLGEVEPTLLEALDPPSSKNIRRAIDSLKEVKALTNAENLTPLGLQLAKLPLDVFLGKLIIHGAFFRCLDAAVSIAAILSSKSPFVNTMGSNTQKDLARLSFRKGDSDLLTVYNAYCAWKRARNTPGVSEYAFCRKNFLSSQTLLNIEDVKMQLIVSIADTGLLTLDPAQKALLNRSRSNNRSRNFFTIPEEYDYNSVNDTVVNSVVAWSFYPKLLTRDGKGWRNVANNQSVTLHPTSVNKQADSSLKWLSYYHIMQGRNKNYNAFETTAVDDFAIALLCGEVEFKMYSGIISIDSNRIRFSTRDWKAMLALKTLSFRIRDILQSTFREPHRVPSYKQQQWLDIWQTIFAQAQAAKK